MIKVVIFNGYGMSGFPVHIQKQIKEKEYPHNRCGSVIDILEDTPEFEGDLKELQQAHDRLKLGDVIRVGKTCYFGIDPFPVKCEIVEVDNTRPWTISEYDGAEYIEYLDYTCIDEELNYCEK